MRIRQKFRQFKSSVSSRLGLDAPLRNHGTSPVYNYVSPPGVPPSNTTLDPTAKPINSGSDINASRTVQESLASPGEQAPACPSATHMTLTQAVGEVSSGSQPEITSDWGAAVGQSAGPHIPVATSSRVAATPAPHTRSGSTRHWVGLNSFLRVLNKSTRMLGPLKGVADELVECIEIYERVANGREDFKALRTELNILFEDLQKHFSPDGPPTITTSMESLCNSVQKELTYVKEKQDRRTASRCIEAGKHADNVLACYRRIQSHLQRLSLNANLSMWKIANEQITDARLDRLCQSLAACYNSAQATELKRGACTEGTRVGVLSEMYAWVHKRGAGSVYWLNGMAGTGKTTIAYSLCTELDAAHNLGASFFCSRSLPECRDVNKIVPSIAYQLAHFSRPFRWALSRVLEKERNVHTQLLYIQFEKLIVRPLMEVRDTLPEALVVVIDALDECDNKKSTGQILEALLTKTSDLPIKFFVASRPEPQIRDQMKKQGGHRTLARLVLHELNKGMVQKDIETYLRAGLASIEPSEWEIARLVRRAGILFIYAATVVRYIGYDDFSKNPRKRLDNILNSSSAGGKNPYRDIDELYTLILEAAMDDPGLEDEEQDDTKRVLHAVLCVREPLTMRVLSGLLGLKHVERVYAALRPLWSVLHVVEPSGLVTTLHASFPDYMFNPKRSKGYFCDQTTQNQTLAQCCFDCIKDAKPQFNICRLESSFVADREVANLSARVEKAISVELFYACRYWAAHLERANGSPDAVEWLEEFLSLRLLLWMEVMNLKKCMSTGVGVIRLAEEWCMRQGYSEELTHLMYDAWRFVTAFALSPLSQSTPHIYVSMLPFWPNSSPIAKHYATRMKGMIQPQGPAMARRNLALLATWPMNGGVTAVGWSPDGSRIALVADGQLSLHHSLTGQLMLGPIHKNTQLVQFSPDGNLIAFGSDDGAIYIWESKSGKVIGPLAGHTGLLKSVAFSPDCARIVSGSSDGTMHMWRIRGKRKIYNSFEGHVRSVTSVAFSPDGTRIVSGSHDKTIRVWNARTGQMVFSPLRGHRQGVTSVAFSPDGARIVSGSRDMTICIWDSQSGKLVLPPLKGHIDAITSIIVSPNGTCIASSSRDKTIRLWDAQRGRLILPPFKEHKNWVNSIAFSPDSTRIISGSGDRTIRMWDTRSGQAVLPPLQAHTRSISSVVFSADGTRIISGSWDKTICIWDAQSGKLLLPPLEGHSSYVCAVAISVDGTHIVSGSWDKTIRLWDAQSGQTILDPLEGHTDWVRSVAFSYDGSRIVSGSDDRIIYVWDTQSGQKVLALKGHTSSVTSVAFSPDGIRIVSGSWDKTIRLWDAQSGQTLLSPLKGHTEWVRSVVFSLDGIYILSSSDDTTIRMWDTRTGQVALGPLEGHAGGVNSVAFSPDGTYILSCSRDGTTRFWDARDGQTVLPSLKRNTRSVNAVAFSPDGTRIVYGCEDGTLHIRGMRTEREPTVSAACPDHNFSGPPSWTINEDGWVTSHERESMLVWVPPDLRPVLLPPGDIFEISTRGYLYLNFDAVRIGESWTKCFQPARYAT